MTNRTDIVKGIKQTQLLSCSVIITV